MLVVSRVSSEAANNRDLKPWWPPPPPGQEASAPHSTPGFGRQRRQGPPERGARVPSKPWAAHRGDEPRTFYKPNVSALPFELQRRARQSVRPCVCRPAPKRFESWHCFFCVCVSCVFFEILLTSGFRLVQNSLKKRKQLVILAAIKSHPTQRK